MEQKQQDTSMTVPASTLQAILNYLATKPFNEVSGLIDLLRNTAKVSDGQVQQEQSKEVSVEA